MARYTCVRCGATCQTTDPPHLCADKAARLRRRERQRDEAAKILRAAFPTQPPAVINHVAEVVVRKLAQLGVTED